MLKNSKQKKDGSLTNAKRVPCKLCRSFMPEGMAVVIEDNFVHQGCFDKAVKKHAARQARFGR